MEDKTEEKGYYDSGFINIENLLKIGAVAAGTYAGYKSGLFKQGIKALLTEAAEHKPTVSILSNNLRTWINSEGLDYTEQSIFRRKITQSVKDLITFDKIKRNKIYEDTLNDIQHLKNRINAATEIASRKTSNDIVINSYRNTQLLQELEHNRKSVDFYSDELKAGKKTLESKLNVTTIKKHIDSEKVIKDSLRSTGTRKAELNDLFDFYVDSRGKIHLTEKTNFSFSRVDSNGKSYREKIEELLNSKAIDESGIDIMKDGKTMRMHEFVNDWKHMHLDKNLRITEEGKFIDIRNRMRQTDTMIRNLASDWKIPFININPARLVGLNKIGREKFYSATISENTVAPALTGVYGRAKENTIKNLKDKIDVLKGINEGVTIIDGDVFRVNKNGSISKLAYTSKKNITFIPASRDKGTSYLNITENAQRKMFGLNMTEYTEYTEEELAKMNKLKRITKKIADGLDIGRQERTHIKEKVDDYTNIDNYIESSIVKFTKKINPYKERKEVKHLSALMDFDDTAKDSFFITNRAIGFSTLFKDVKDNVQHRTFNNINKENFNRFWKQLTGSMNGNYEDLNAVSAVPYFIMERLNQGISSLGLGLNIKNTKSTLGTLKNIILKRFLPVYGAYHMWNIINSIGEDNTDNGTKPGNLDQHIKAGIAKIDIGFHSLGDLFGVPKVFKKIVAITPGSDMLGELPGVNLFTPTQTADERTEYWKNGYTPVRKGRYWSLNTTPFVGGKISYWKPNMLRESLADAKYSDSLYGSRKEYYANFFNLNHYDKKNYYTRPYLLTSSPFENVPFFGPTLSWLTKPFFPQKKMHLEYWNKNGTVKTPFQLSEEQKQIGYMTVFNNKSNNDKQQQLMSKYQDIMTLQTVYKLNNNPIASDLQYNDYLKYAFNTSYVNQYSNNPSIYQFLTSSGASRTIGFGGESATFAPYKINKEGYTLGNLMSANDNINLQNQYISGKLLEQIKYSDVSNPNSLANTIKNQFVNTADVSGIYGFGITSLATGKPGAGSSQIETSGYSRSFNRTFWDQNVGGLSGDLSEIFRRLMQNRRSDINYYNPVRNRMPQWLPGENGFINFQVGDPYTKVAKGEERLPGEGYERLNHIEMPTLLRMNVGSSTIGKTKDEIIKHFLHQDEITDKDALSITKAGSKIHNDIESKLIKSGIAIDTERKIEDKEHGVIGYYDARIYDASSRSGEAIVDIKTVSDKKYKQIQKTKTPFDEHQRQVNFYLHNTDKNNRGYILYVNRDNPDDDTITLGFNYNHKMYKSTMATLDSARQEVFDMLNQGVISRGDLYKPVDKFRILADVAPYSDEFAALNKQMSNMDLTDEEQKEVKAIRDRVSAQRQQTRFYNYRFKNNDVIEQKVKIESQIDNQTFKIKGSDTPIKLAGLKIKRTSKTYEQVQQILDEYMSPGKTVKIEIAEDSTQRYNNDLLKSAKATVISDGVNVNKLLIKNGLVEEDEKDFSAAGVHARFSSLQRKIGSVWESIAHFDSYANTKLLQVRTASEDYERKRIYGKEFRDWKHPIKDFLKPSLDANINRGLIYGTATGLIIGKMFGSTRYGALVGSAVGFGTTITGKIYKHMYQMKTGEKWVPSRVRKQREIEDYMDKLTFVKNRRLYEIYAEKALKEDHFDVSKFISDNAAFGAMRKAKSNGIKNVKKQYKLTGNFNVRNFEKAGVKFDWKDKFLPGFIRSALTKDNETRRTILNNKIMDFGVNENLQAQAENREKSISKVKNTITRIKEDMNGNKDAPHVSTRRRGSIKHQWDMIKKYFNDYSTTSTKKKRKALEKTVNTTINDYDNYKRTFKLPENAMKAIEFYNKSESTMYGYDPGESLTNFMSALPKADRNYFREFIKAPQRERKKIMEMAPSYMRRALQASYGMPVDPKENLDKYFKEHYLPDKDWAGWNEGVDMNSVKVKLVQTQGERLQEYNLWEDDKLRADALGKMQIPNIHYRTKSLETVKSKLEDLLGKSGYTNINIDFKYGAVKPNINIKSYKDNEDKYKEKIQERLNDI